MFFKTKTETKYFLTIIGDCIRNVDKDLVYIASPVMKKLVREINVQIHIDSDVVNGKLVLKSVEINIEIKILEKIYID